MPANARKSGRAAFLRKFRDQQASIFNAVRADIDDAHDYGVQACLEATFGRGASLNCLLGSNAVERARIASRLAGRANSYARTNGLEMAVVVIRDQAWEFEQNASVLDLPLIRRTSAALKRLSDSSIGVVQVGCLPHPGGSFRYVPQVKAAVFGRNLQQRLPAEAAKLQRKWQVGPPFQQPIELNWPNQNSSKVRFTTIVKLFSLADPLKPAVPKCACWDSSLARVWREGRHQRATGRYQILTLCPLDRLVIATGELAPVLSGALAEGVNRARKLYAAGDKPLHRDQVVHFWIEQQLRRQQLFVPPFVKAR